MSPHGDIGRTVRVWSPRRVAPAPVHRVRVRGDGRTGGAMNVMRLGRGSVLVEIGHLRVFTTRHPQRAAYVDWMPSRWRLIASRHPVRLPFSERYGYRPGPRVTRLGPLDIAWYGHPE